MRLRFFSIFALTAFVSQPALADDDVRYFIPQLLDA